MTVGMICDSDDACWQARRSLRAAGRRTLFSSGGTGAATTFALCSVRRRVRISMTVSAIITTAAFAHGSAESAVRKLHGLCAR